MATMYRTLAPSVLTAALLAISACSADANAPTPEQPCGRITIPATMHAIDNNRQLNDGDRVNGDTGVRIDLQVADLPAECTVHLLDRVDSGRYYATSQATSSADPQPLIDQPVGGQNATTEVGLYLAYGGPRCALSVRNIKADGQTTEPDDCNLQLIGKVSATRK